MRKPSQFLEKYDGISDNSCTDIEQLIKSFEDANLSLRIALEREIESGIEELSSEVDQSINNLLYHTCETKAEKKLLCKFLIEKFLLNDESQDGIRRRICNKVLSEI